MTIDDFGTESDDGAAAADTESEPLRVFEPPRGAGAAAGKPMSVPVLVTGDVFEADGEGESSDMSSYMRRSDSIREFPEEETVPGRLEKSLSEEAAARERIFACK